MIRRPPRSTLSSSSAASDVYKRQGKLSVVLSEFARTLLTDFPIQAILDHLVERIVEALPVTAVGITLISPGSDPHYIAASDESALAFERLQTEFGQGRLVGRGDVVRG